MTNQEMVDHIAVAAKPRLADLLKLKVRHVYEMTPGAANSKLVVDGSEVQFKLVRAAQLYQDIERFMAEDKLMGFVVTPGVLPIVKAIAMDIRGRRMLVTRRVQSGPDESGAFAYVEDFGIRVVLDESQVVWECLYAVA